MNKCNVLDLRPEAGDDFELSFGAAVGLRLVKSFLRDFLGEYGGGFGLLENAILTKSEEGFKEVLTNGKAEDELLPREERAIEVPREALCWIVMLASCVHDDVMLVEDGE